VGASRGTKEYGTVLGGEGVSFSMPPEIGGVLFFYAGFLPPPMPALTKIAR
jgi:hypothetical protein